MEIHFKNNVIYLELIEELINLNKPIEEFEHMLESHATSISFSYLFNKCINKEEVEYEYAQLRNYIISMSKLNTSINLTDVLCPNLNIEKIYLRLINNMTQESLNYINDLAEQKIESFNYKG